MHGLISTLQKLKYDIPKYSYQIATGIIATKIEFGMIPMGIQYNYHASVFAMYNKLGSGLLVFAFSGVYILISDLYMCQSLVDRCE